MININNLTFTYRNSSTPSLNKINLNIEKGDFVGIIGESGAGKTTLTYVINGIIPHHYDGDYYGTVSVNGLDTFENSAEKLALYVGSVFQDIDSRMVAAVVEDEILFGLENFGIPSDEIESRITEALEATGISDLRMRNISTLSGGQKQKVALSAMIALKPQILVLDEPTGELDPKSSRQIFSLLRELNQKLGITVIIVEQKIMLLSEFANKLIVMNKGSVIYYDTVKNVLKNSSELEKLGINVPRTVTLSNILNEKGLSDNFIGINISETESEIRRILS